MKITDTLITTLFKHGALIEMKNFETTIPFTDPESNVHAITIKADIIQFKLETEDK